MEELYFHFIHCYRDGIWIDNMPYISICHKCQNTESGFESSYCDPKCVDKMRDECFYKQYRFESDTDYYPSDFEYNDYKDKRVLKLEKVEERPYYMGGKEILSLFREASRHYSGQYCDADEAFDEALNEIRILNYRISKKRFAIIFYRYFK
jgi:hypothetical protein